MDDDIITPADSEPDCLSDADCTAGQVCGLGQCHPAPDCHEQDDCSGELICHLYDESHPQIGGSCDPPSGPSGMIELQLSAARFLELLGAHGNSYHVCPRPLPAPYDDRLVDGLDFGKTGSLAMVTPVGGVDPDTGF